MLRRSEGPKDLSRHTLCFHMLGRRPRCYQYKSQFVVRSRLFITHLNYTMLLLRFHCKLSDNVVSIASLWRCFMAILHLLRAFMEAWIEVNGSLRQCRMWLQEKATPEVEKHPNQVSCRGCVQVEESVNSQPNWKGQGVVNQSNASVVR